MVVQAKQSYFYLLIAVGMSVAAVMTNFGQMNTAYILGLIGLVTKLYSILLKRNTCKRTIYAGAVYSLLLSLAITLSREVHYVEMRSSELLNYIDVQWIHFPLALLLAVIIYPAIVLLMEFFHANGLKNKLQIQKKVSYPFFLCAWAVILLCWLPYLLTFYPGGVVGDGAHAIEEALTPGFPNHRHWGVMHILALKFFFWLGSRFSADINTSIYLYVITHTISFSGICAYIAAAIRKKGFPPVVAWAVVLVYAFSGFFASYGMSLWKDGLFGGAVVLLALHLWDYPEDSRVSRSYAVKYILLGLFICFWRNNGFALFLLINLGCALLLKKTGKPLAVLALLVFVITIVVQGPIYEILDVGKDPKTEILVIPLQQVAAVINEGVELTPSQKDFLFSLLPEDQWLANYCPTLVDDIKAPAGLNAAHWGFSELFVFFKVWLQLLLPNLKTYVEAYLMQMLGFWQVGTEMSNYFDYWIGIQDLFHRGIVAQDLIQNHFGVSIRDLLMANMNFLSSGTMVWIMVFSFVTVWGQGHEVNNRLLALLPLMASWLIILLAAPIAYAYRYVVMLPIAFPLFILIPLYHTGIQVPDRAREGTVISWALQRRIGVGIALLGLVCTVCGCAKDISVVQKYSEEPFTVHCSGEQYNAMDYIQKGLSGNENAFSWTDGNLLSVRIPSENRCGTVKVFISIDGTFNGEKSYRILSNEAVLAEGSMSGAGMITFEVDYDNSYISFDIEMPDAQIINEVFPDNADLRKVAFRIIEITVEEA